MDANTPIDLVIPWVDGNDPQWQAQRNALKGEPDASSTNNAKCRYIDNDELLYALRSIDKNAPWIRRIYLITDHQVPRWLNTDNEKIRVIDHTEILPPEALPCFSSITIEHCIHHIPGLSEHFIYGNDDCFINRPVTPADFFTPEGHPIVRLRRKFPRELSVFWKRHFRKRKISSHKNALLRASRLVKRDYGTYFNSEPHHNLDAYRRSDYAAVADHFKADIAPTLTHHFRNDSDIHRVIYSYVPIILHKAELRYVSHEESFRISIHRRHRYATMLKANPLFFCINDSERAIDDDRRLSHQFMETLFTQKSQFER